MKKQTIVYKKHYLAPDMTPLLTEEGDILTVSNLDGTETPLENESGTWRTE